MLKQAIGMKRRNKRKSTAIQSKKRERLHRVVSAYETMSTELPTKKTVSKNFQQKWVLDKSINKVYQEYKMGNPSPVCFSSFAKSRPKHLLRLSKKRLNQCLCEYCQNIELKIEILRRTDEKFLSYKDVYDISDTT